MITEGERNVSMENRGSWISSCGLSSVWRSYVLRRILKSVITVYLVVSASFFLVRYMPGNPVQVLASKLAGTEGLTHDNALKQASNLLSFDPNASILDQYMQYIAGLLHGNLGVSLTSPGTKVISEVFSYLPWTLFSVGLGLLIAFILGILLGILTAYRRGGALDHGITNVSSLVHAVPNYVWAMLILVVLGSQLGLLDITSMRGTHTPGVNAAFSFTFFSDVLYHAALPIAVYVLTSMGQWILVMKSSTTQVLDEDFVTVAKARGLRSRRIRVHYVGRNAMLPLVASFAIAVGSVVGGSVLIEQIFQYNGVGYFLYESISQRDYPVMEGFILIMTVSVIVMNLIADLLLSRIDPRIRSGEGH